MATAGAPLAGGVACDVDEPAQFFEAWKHEIAHVLDDAERGEVVLVIAEEDGDVRMGIGTPEQVADIEPPVILGDDVASLFGPDEHHVLIVSRRQARAVHTRYADWGRMPAINAMGGAA